jgi:putative radical SAM enzyme (TIGR03279 family)
MSSPRVVAVAPGSPAHRAGVLVDDEIVAVDGEAPRDVIEWRWLTDEPDPVLDVRRGGLELTVEVPKAAGEQLGIEVHSSLFDQVRTCDNHCEFCFIYQLPPGLRKSLYLKDDDYRLSFLYGNFTTLTRFTESDLERVVTEGISPLNVSIHATDPDVRAAMLRNRRGATSLRWLRALLDHGVEVHGQVVCCPGVNDGAVLADTLAGVLDRYPELASLCVVPLGVSRHNTEARMRPTTQAAAERVVDVVHAAQERFLRVLGRRLVFAADEYYLLAHRPFPEPDAYEGFAMHEDGIGMARTFELEFRGDRAGTGGVESGFFAWVDAAEAARERASGAGEAGRTTRYEAAGDLGAPAEGYRAVRGGCPAGVEVGTADTDAPVATAVALRPRPPRPDAPVGVLTSTYGARVVGPLLAASGRTDVRAVPVENRYFGGNVAVTGLMVGEDLARTLAAEPAGHRYLLPDVCLSGGRFLDGTTPADLPRPVEVVPTDGAALRRALEVPALTGAPA